MRARGRDYRKSSLIDASVRVNTDCAQCVPGSACARVRYCQREGEGGESMAEAEEPGATAEESRKEAPGVGV